MSAADRVNSRTWVMDVLFERPKRPQVETSRRTQVSHHVGMGPSVPMVDLHEVGRAYGLSKSQRYYDVCTLERFGLVHREEGYLRLTEDGVLWGLNYFHAHPGKGRT